MAIIKPVSSIHSMARHVTDGARTVYQRAKPYFIPILLLPVMPGIMAMGRAPTVRKPGSTIKIRRTELFVCLRNIINTHADSIATRLKYNNPVYHRDQPGTSFPDIYPTAFAQSDLAVAFARIGETEEAEKHIHAVVAVTDIRCRAYLLSSAAIAFVELGKTKEASLLIEEAKNIELKQMRNLDAERSFAARKTIEALVVLDRKAEAVAHVTAAAIQNPARAFIEMGEFERTLARKDLGQRERAHALAGIGKVKEALRLAAPLAQRNKIHLLDEIAIALVRSGNVERAQEIFLERSKLPGKKAVPRTEIGIALLRSGNSQKALSVVGTPKKYIAGLQGYRPDKALDLLGRLAQALLNADAQIAGEGRIAALKDHKAKLQQAEKERQAQLAREAQERAAHARKEEEKRLAEEGARRAQEEKIEGFRDKMKEITGAIEERLAKALGLAARHGATTSEGDDGHYATILTAGLRQAPILSQRPTLQLSRFQLSVIDVREGMGLDALRRRLKCLNILVPHEVAHVIQRERKIPRPRIDTYKILDPKKARHHANEVLCDKLGFDAARLIYVHGDGDILFSERIREAIAIEAYIAFAEILLKNLEAGIHKFPDENAARTVAVLRQIARSEAIAKPTRTSLLQLAEAFWQRITTDSTPERKIEFAQLIGEYETIFSTTRLEI